MMTLTIRRMAKTSALAVTLSVSAFALMAGHAHAEECDINTPGLNGTGGATSNPSGTTLACGPDANAQGNNSTAVGSNANANPTANGGPTADDATAIGGNARALHESATAVGADAVANGQGDVAVGEDASGTGPGAVAVGGDNNDDGTGTVAVGAGATAVGSEAEAFGNGALAIGGDSADADNVGAVATQDRATAIGSDGQALGVRSTAVGSQALAVGDRASAFGSEANADGDRSTAVGTQADAFGTRSVAVGNESQARGFASIAIGNNADTGIANVQGADHAIAIGNDTKAREAGSVALGTDSGGIGASTTRENQFVLGTRNHTFTAAGITSEASRSFQSGPLDVVTTDAQGNLASDGGQIFRQLGEQGAGIAIATALENPDLVNGETFGLAANIGFFEGNSALAIAAMGVIGQNFMGANERWAVSGGVGVSLNENDYGGQSTDRTVAGRAGVQVSW